MAALSTCRFPAAASTRAPNALPVPSDPLSMDGGSDEAIAL